MRLVDIMPIQEYMLETNLPSDDYGEYDSEHYYSSGEIAVVSSTNMLYQSLVDDNKGVWPEDGRLEVPPKWKRLRPTNTWAMFDGKLNTSSESEEMMATGHPGISAYISADTHCDTLALFGVSSDSVLVEVGTSSGEVVYSREVDTLSSPNVVDWYSYFTEPLAHTGNIVLTDMNVMPGDTIEIFIRGEPAMCSHVLVGRSVELGKAIYGSSVGITDYSTKEFDEFGSPVIVERGFSKKGNFDVEMPAQRLDNAIRKMQEYRATATLWIGSDIHDATMIYGFYWDFEVVLESHGNYELAIEIEGLTE